MTSRWSITCDACGGEGLRDGECDCMDDTCCCRYPSPPDCHCCDGKGFYIVTKLTDDNCEEAIPLD